MMADDSITEQSPVDIDKAAKWTVFLLVDLRVLFIITYAYVSVVNLISTTANGEASEDILSTRLFTVTSQPEHANVNVSFIDDAILWNCREHSVTKHYYRGLYWMLISAFSATMIAYILTKIAITFGAKHGDHYLWRLAVMECWQQLKLDEEVNEPKKPQEADSDKDTNKGKNEANQKVIEKVIKLLNNKDPSGKISDNEDKGSFKMYNRRKNISLFLSVAILATGIILTFLFYDLHPLSCIHGQREKYIDYNETEESVRVHFSKEIVRTQKGVGIILPLLALAFVFNAFAFYHCNVCIIKIFVRYVEKESKNETDSSKESCSCSCCCSCCEHVHFSRLRHCLCFFIHE